MDDQVKAVQERLRASMAQPMEVGEQASGLPIVAFEDVAGLPDGAETLVHRVVAALKARGYRVACLRRFGVNGVPESVGEPGRPYTEAGADAVVFAAPGRVVKVEPVEAEPSLDQMLENGVPESVGEPGRPYTEAGADAVVFAAPGRVVKVEPVEAEPSLDQMLETLGDPGAYDVVLCESFGYLPLPKVLVTRKAQEGFNLGLPNVIAYVSNQPDNAMVIPYFAPDDEGAIATFIERRIMGVEEEPAAPEEPKGVEQP